MFKLNGRLLLVALPLALVCSAANPAAAQMGGTLSGRVVVAGKMSNIDHGHWWWWGTSKC